MYFYKNKNGAWEDHPAMIDILEYPSREEVLEAVRDGSFFGGEIDPFEQPHLATEEARLKWVATTDSDGNILAALGEPYQTDEEKQVIDAQIVKQGPFAGMSVAELKKMKQAEEPAAPVRLTEPKPSIRRI